ncbi:choline dehydrogenase-like protein [Clohesyomyces aquaticus]|uniref:Choline dehydrogenase-like protein n=1 Tax=Clohesyomyces aquaticus TaxID=1231657 RepID=A0A1Y1ZFV5_9PLEO|nr:choline dehydrogenase-like protein [Clohesyomyces aquaticus]
MLFITRSSFVLLVLASVAYTAPTTQKTYDYVIVGGGTTGLVMANRLSEDSDKSILVIENGILNNGTLSSIPGNSGGLNLAAMYDIHSAPEPNLGNKNFLVTVGNVVGGGSYVNGMQFDRGADADYDAWGELGNEGWDWNGIQPYFFKSNSFDPPSKETIAAFNISYDVSAYGHGPLRVSIPDYQFPDMKPMFDSWCLEPIPQVKEGFKNPVGLYWSPNSVNKATATRTTSRSAYYDTIADRRPNLKLMTNTHVDEIIFEKTRLGLVATGVKYTPNDAKMQSQVFAAKEVILAAGGVFTPHLLMVSGIGPKDVLQAAGVTVKKDLSAVGSNFQDHIANYMNFKLEGLDPENIPALATNATFNQTSYNQYLANHTGPYSVGKSNGLVFIALQHFDSAYQKTVDTIKSQVATKYLPERYSKNKQLLAGYLKQRDILAKQFSGVNAAVGEIVIKSYGSSSTANNKPLSRGTITLNSTNPAGFPVVQWNTFMNPVDASVIVSLARFNRKHWTRPELAHYKPVETAPGPQYQTDEEIIQGGITSGSLAPSFAHPCGSCAMMPENLGGCVSDQLLVYGIQRLSVIDASILPMIPATHLQATMYAVAEKAADIVKSRA